MRKKALAKDFRMEIRKSLNRFLSIFFIVALGVAFFAGVRATEPDMRYSGDEYFDERNMMDLKVMSTLGLTDDDMDAILAVEGVEAVNPGYMIDVLSMVGESERIIHVESLPETMNQVDIVEGRLPGNAGECIVDVDAAASYGIQIGDVLEFKSGNDQELDETLQGTSFEVVGTCSSPVYISFGRGSTNIGNGEIDMFAYIDSTAFCQEVYSQAWITAAGAKEVTAFTDAYTDIVDRVKEQVEGIEDVRCDIRYTEILEEANGEIGEAESELADAREEVDAELAEAEEELRDGEAQIADGREKLLASEKDLADARNQLISSRSTLDDGWNQYNSGLADLETGKAQLAEAEEELAANEKRITEGENALLAAEQQISDNENQILQGETALASAKEELAAKEQELAAMETALEQAKSWSENMPVLQQAYTSGMTQLESLKTQLTALEQIIVSETATPEEVAQAQVQAAQLREMISQMEAGLAEQKVLIDTMEQQRPSVEAILAKEADIVSGRSQLEAGKAEIEAQQTALSEGRTRLEAGKAELELQKATLSEGRAQLEAGKAALAGTKQTMLDGEAELKASYTKLMDGEAAYQSGLTQMHDGETQIASAYATIAENEQKIADGWIEYEDGKKEAEDELAEAEQKIADAKEDVAALEKPVWYVNDRDSDTDYVGYSDNADRMGAIGKVFPLLFFLVAAFVSLTTMTRMVEEQRMQIGTLKALGYSKFWIAAKFVGYALIATLGGSIVGVLFGQKVFPLIIVNAYKIIYIHMPNVVVPYNMHYAVMATVAAVACTMVATINSCYAALAAQPAELMRPEAPKVGKKVLLERIPAIWIHLSFTWKSTIRNLMRYKKRFFMTIFGIGGCMALMLVGYGLKDSIMDVAILQFDKIQVYDLMAIVDEDIADGDREELHRTLEEDDRVNSYMDGYMRMTEMTFGDVNKDIYLYVPSRLDGLDQFVTFNYRTTGETWYLDEDSVVITEKVARDLGISKGDKIQIKLEDDRRVTVEITDICENYLSHYLYIAPQLYASIAGAEPEYNNIFATVREDAEDELTQVGEELLKNDAVLTVSYTNNMAEILEDMIQVLDSVIIVLIVSAGMLAFVVLYNLNNININERKRELATLKVLGFYDSEVGAYVYRENILLTLIGSGVGVFLGKWLHRFVVRTVEVDQTMFGLNITLESYLISIAFTILFSLLVNGMMYFKLKKIDMVESLKSVE